MTHDIEAISNKWKKYIDYLIERCDFATVLNGKLTGSMYDWYTDNREALSVAGLSFHCGMTRMVFEDKSCDYVVKIMFPEATQNYNENEAEVYRLAEKEGLEKYFAWTKKIFDYSYEYDGETKVCSVYAMEYCDVDDEANESACEDYFYEEWCDEQGLDYEDPENRSNFDSPYIDDEEVMAFAEHCWGEALGRLDRFLQKVNVNDLHTGNWGYRSEDEFVICDYAGYMVKVGLGCGEEEE